MFGVEIGIVWVVEGHFVEARRGSGCGAEAELLRLSFWMPLLQFLYSAFLFCGVVWFQEGLPNLPSNMNRNLDP